jgi:hypothetical protein
MKINHIIHEAGTGLEIDRSIPGRTIARISGDLAYRTGPLTDKKLPDHHDDYTPWSGKVGASTRDDEEDTFDIDYTGDDGELKEFVTPQATAQDPGLEREPNVDVLVIGLRPEGSNMAVDIAMALEEILPNEYPKAWRRPNYDGSKVQRVIRTLQEKQIAAVTTKPLSTAQKLVKTFQTYGVKCRINAPGLEEGTAGLPDPQNFDSDNDYYDARDAYAKPQAMDADYENMTSEPDDWFDESREKVGNMDADAFDAALSRMKKLAGAGPLKTVYDPNKRVYKNVPHAVQPAQQPKKAR